MYFAISLLSPQGKGCGLIWTNLNPLYPGCFVPRSFGEEDENV